MAVQSGPQTGIAGSLAIFPVDIVAIYALIAYGTRVND